MKKIYIKVDMMKVAFSENPYIITYPWIKHISARPESLKLLRSKNNFPKTKGLACPINSERPYSPSPPVLN